MSFNRLDLPDPFSPTRPTRALGGSAAQTRSRMTWPPRRSVMPSIVSMGADLTATRLPAPRPYFVRQSAGFLPMLTLPHESRLASEKRTRSGAMRSTQGHAPTNQEGDINETHRVCHHQSGVAFELCLRRSAGPRRLVRQRASRSSHASGEMFNPDGLTVARKSLPF